MSIATRGGRS